MMNFADGFGLGRVCLVLGVVLMVWGACREPMMPTRAAVVSRHADVPSPAAHSPGDEDEIEENVLVIARHEEGKAKR